MTISKTSIEPRFRSSCRLLCVRNAGRKAVALWWGTITLLSREAVRRWNRSRHVHRTPKLGERGGLVDGGKDAALDVDGADGVDEDRSSICEPCRGADAGDGADE